jgi:hypothetical protein
VLKKEGSGDTEEEMPISWEQEEPSEIVTFGLGLVE